ncbi:MAG TPA: ATP-binding cassette domain-containing protein, partial [Acidimicrobiales bacterium]
WPVEPEGAPGPVPARVIDVGYRYREGRDLALDGVSMEVEVGQYVAIVGPNGSGKSTLGRVVAGLPPTAGAVARPGPAGLGRLGGTAMVFQRPESQVLGARVKDDIRWGLPAGAGMDTGTALEAVGLAGLADRETATLSGGELQRVALAAALARRPALLVADEATAMLDADGRRDVVATLHSLVGQGLTVIAITHHLDEVGPEDVLVRLDAGRVVSGAVTGAGSGGANGRPAGSATGSATGDARGAGEATGPGATPDARPGSPEGRSLRLRGVGYVHAWRSPWAHRALEGIDLDVAPGEAVLVVGPNGAGKTTLGWVVAGLVPPTEGTVRFGPGPPSPGDVGIGFQHARLQLFRPTVEEDVGLGGAAPADVDTALRSVALDPDAYRHRLIDALSGGEQRRVALAGLLVRKPTLLVLDEPFAGLDPSGRAVLVSVLSWLVGSGLALLLISHDVVEGRSVCGRVLGLSAGRVSFDGPMGGADLDSLMATAPAGPAGT